MSTAPLANLREIRLQKAAALRERGINPYPSRSARSHYARQIIDDYAGLEGQPVTVAGRLMSWRKQGGMSFGHLQDQSGSIQIVLRRATLKPTDAAQGTLGYEDLNLMDLGDIVQVTG